MGRCPRDDVRPPLRAAAVVVSGRGYRALLALPGAPALLVNGLIGRLPTSMLPVTIVIAGERASGSYAVGGAASAGFSLAAALAAPVTGRLVDRRGQRRAGRLLLVAALVALAALIGVVVSGTLVALIVPLSVLAGATLPNVGTYSRVRWGSLVTGGDVETAQALESLNDEVNFLVGPAAGAILAASVGPTAPLVAATAAAAVGTLAVTASRVPEPTRAAPDTPGAPGVADAADTVNATDAAASAMPSAPAPRTRRSRIERLDRAALVAVLVGLGMALNGVLVAVVATSEALGRPGLASVVFALNSGASLATALVVGRLRFRMLPRRRITVAVVVFGVTLVPFALVDSVVGFALAGMLAGAAIAPTFIQVNAHVATTTEPGRTTEAFSWISATVGVGLAIGAAVTGAAIDRVGEGGARVAVLAMALLPGAVALVTDRVLARAGADATGGPTPAG